MQTTLYVASGILMGLLVIAEITIRFYFKSVKLRQYLYTWWGLVIILAGAIFLQDQFVVILWGGISFAALREYISIIPLRRVDRPALWACFASIPVQYYWVAIKCYDMFISFIPLYMLLILEILLIRNGQIKGLLYAIGRLHWGVMTVVFNVSHAAFLQGLPADPKLGAALLLCLLFFTAFNDLAQQIWEKIIGRHPLFPSLTLQKTWEGSVGGMFTTTALMVASAPFFTPLTPWSAFVAGLIISVGGLLGKLSLYAIKRDIGIIENNQTLHSGILNRLDSLLFTAPLFFHFVRYFYF